MFHAEIMQPHELGAPVWYHRCFEVYQCQSPNGDTYCRSCLKAGCQQRLGACFRPHQSWGTFRGIGDDLVFRRAQTRNSGLLSPARNDGHECQDNLLSMVGVGIPPCIPPDQTLCTDEGFAPLLQTLVALVMEARCFCRFVSR